MKARARLTKRLHASVAGGARGGGEWKRCLGQGLKMALRVERVPSVYLIREMFRA